MIDTIIIKFENLIGSNPIKAVHLIKKAIDENPNNADYLEAFGVYLCNLKKDKEGIKYLQRAEKITELKTNSIFSLAISLMRVEQYGLAIKYYRQISNFFPEAYYNAALCYIRMNKIEEAVAELRPLISGKILRKEAMNLIIDLYSYTKNTEKLNIELENYTKNYGQDGYYHFLKGNEFFSKKNFFESAYHYAKIANHEIHRDQYNEKYAYSLSKIKQYDKAEKIFQEFIDTNLPNEQLMIEYAKVLIALEKFQEAIDILTENHYSESVKREVRDLISKAYYKLNLE